MEYLDFLIDLFTDVCDNIGNIACFIGMWCSGLLITLGSIMLSIFISPYMMFLTIPVGLVAFTYCLYKYD